MPDRSKSPFRAKKENPCEIYALCDPDTGEFKYVGQSVNAQNRYSGHMGDARDSYTQNSAKAKWINSLLAQQKLPELFILEKTTVGEANEREDYWILILTKHGYKLTNRPTYRTNLLTGFNRTVER